MSDKLSFDLQHTALLIMDYQNDILKNVADAPGLLKRASAVLEKARASHLPVFYIQVAFREGHPELSAKHPTFGAVKNGKMFVLGTPGAEIHEAIKPRANEPVIVKKRISAFAGSDLDVILRGHEIKTLVLMGISTSGVVLSTLRYAADQDFQCIVIEDCCADTDEEVHRVLTTKIFPRQAKVVSSAQFIQSL